MVIYHPSGHQHLLMGSYLDSFQLSLLLQISPEREYVGQQYIWYSKMTVKTEACGSQLVLGQP